MAAKGATESLIGVDVGSTHIKAVLAVPGSGVIHVARRDTVTHDVSGGGATHRPDEILGAVESAIAECVAAAGAGPKPEAIGIASMAEAGVPIDRRNLPIVQKRAKRGELEERRVRSLKAVYGIYLNDKVIVTSYEEMAERLAREGGTKAVQILDLRS